MDLRIGVIGTGAIGRTHIERINNNLQGGKVVAVSDINAEFGKKVAEYYGSKFFATGEELIASTDVDAIIVTTTDAYHERFVIASIKAGKYVFCEKPLAADREGCKRIVEAEIAAGKKYVQVGFMRRYDAGYKQLKKIVDERQYGEPLMLHCAHRNLTVPRDYNTPMAVENSMIHEIDVLRWLLGEDYATAQVLFPKRTRHAHDDLQDPQILILTTKSGVHIDVEAFVCSGYGYDIKCEICCKDGIVSLPEPSSPLIRTNAACTTAICTDWSQRFLEAYNVEIQLWINATKEERIDGPTAWDGYVGSITAAAASKARDTKTVVNIVMEEYPDLYKK